MSQVCVTNHLNLPSSIDCIKLFCTLNLTRPSKFCNPSRLVILLWSALSSRKCRRHSNSIPKRFSSHRTYNRRKTLRRKESISFLLMSRFSRLIRWLNEVSLVRLRTGKIAENEMTLVLYFHIQKNPDVYLLDTTDNILTDPGTPLSQAIWFEFLVRISLIAHSWLSSQLTSSKHLTEAKTLSTSQHSPNSFQKDSYKSVSPNTAQKAGYPW